MWTLINFVGTILTLCELYEQSSFNDVNAW